jgi:hypothetical protein
VTARLALAALLLTAPLLGFALVPARATDGDGADGTTELPFGTGAWDLRQLSEDPLKLVKATYNPRARPQTLSWSSSGT